MARGSRTWTVVLDGQATKVFRSKVECLDWLYSGLYGTDGAERDHFVDMLAQLNAGMRTILYRRID